MHYLFREKAVFPKSDSLSLPFPFTSRWVSCQHTGKSHIFTALVTHCAGAVASAEVSERVCVSLRECVWISAKLELKTKPQPSRLLSNNAAW